ncbi:hypothetical protein D3C81_1281170 [compost metagenome]
MGPPAVDEETHYLPLVELAGRFASIVQPVDGRLAAIVVDRVVLAVQCDALAAVFYREAAVDDPLV